MRLRPLSSYLVLLLVTLGSLDVAQPQEARTPFWEQPNTKLDLRSVSPIEATLVAGPNLERGLIVLQTGGEAPPVDFVPGAPELVPAKDSGYKVIPNGLNVGATPYGDRTYKISKLPPALAGLTLLQTKAGHKAIVDANYGLIVSVSKPCLVFLALDQRVLDTYQQHGTPSWLEEYAPTGLQIKTDDPIMQESQADYLVFVRSAAAGRIVFGPPAMDVGFNSMYFSFLGVAGGD